MYEILDNRNKCILCKSKLARYNIENYEPIFCEKCINNENMNYNYNYLIKCVLCESNEAFYSIENEYPTHCYKCKDENMIKNRKDIKLNKEVFFASETPNFF